jgi:hypothetical protein
MVKVGAHGYSEQVVTTHIATTSGGRVFIEIAERTAIFLSLLSLQLNQFTKAIILENMPTRVTFNEAPNGAHYKSGRPHGQLLTFSDKKKTTPRDLNTSCLVALPSSSSSKVQPYVVPQLRQAAPPVASSSKVQPYIPPHRRLSLRPKLLPVENRAVGPALKSCLKRSSISSDSSGMSLDVPSNEQTPRRKSVTFSFDVGDTSARMVAAATAPVDIVTSNSDNNIGMVAPVNTVKETTAEAKIDEKLCKGGSRNCKRYE